MRCPKCRYIGFEEQDRCRNCGYDFSLSQPMEPIDLPIRAGDTPTTMADLRLSVQRRRSRGGGPDTARRGVGTVCADPAHARTDRLGGLTPGPFDLPLFNDHRDDIPLVSGNTPPRQPLSVRRAPVTPRPRIVEPAPAAPALDFPENGDLEPPGDGPDSASHADVEPVVQPRRERRGGYVPERSLGRACDRRADR